jgi:putative ABC transport system permease protein
VSWWDTLRTGVDALRSCRLRSGLTVLGILIGIAAVILTVGLGEGAQQRVTASVDALGRNLLVVSPGSATAPTGVRGGLGSASTLTMADAAALASRTVAPDIAAVAPATQRQEVLLAGSANWTTSVVGTTPQWLGIRNRTLSAGRFLNATDVADHGLVTVLGSITAENLFGAVDPVGRSVDIAGVPFTVIGELAPAGTSGSTNLDDMAVVPATTAASVVFGAAQSSSVGTIYLEATSPATLSAAYQEATDELLALHHITTPASADFTIASQQSLLTAATTVSRTLTILLAGIAGISLLVGGIGVMNIMLVSVAERTREIGLRRALGATPAAIRRQFLVEASFLGLLGGLIGAGVGIVGALTLPSALGDPIVVSPVAVGGAVAVAVAIGMVFGVYPAARAAQLAPIDALRSQ